MISKAIAVGAFVVGWTGAAAVALGQTRGGSAVSLGLSFQNGSSLVRSVQHFPIGPQLGFAYQRIASNNFVAGIAADIAYYPQSASERVSIISSAPPGPGEDRDGALALSTAAFRVETPPVLNSRLYVSAGEAFAVATPRQGDRAVPVLAIGFHPETVGRVTLRAGFQYFLKKLGETRRQIPIGFDIAL